MEQNKTGKYFKYAIGEIILVVIGILIALQINNWNEERKNKLFETSILNEIKISMLKDFKRTEYLLEYRVDKKSEAIYNLIQKLQSDILPHDTILRDHLFSTNLGIVFTYDKGPYESLKSIGLDKISNDSLRSSLVRFYEVTLPLAREFIDSAKDSREELRSELSAKICTYNYVEYNNKWRVRKEIDFKTLASNTYFKQLMDLEEDEVRNYISRLKQLINSFETIIKELDTELKK